MRTPDGSECPHYYEDFNRWRSQQECRLIEGNPSSKPWQPPDCSQCAVPSILRANGSPNLTLEVEVKNGGFLWLSRRVQVSVSCTKHRIKIKDPYIGCPRCGENFKNLFKK